ncbi:MAG TPA: DUF5009 domain-containing protein [Flavisolibacter sp.]|nr:DUF5009 domain-containing protein [Flavisolibacter sp.]
MFSQKTKTFNDIVKPVPGLEKPLPQRNLSLDALRGFAILTMVLSGAIAFGGVLPAWMYHAQVPPPLHKFDPSVPGITWVDLVFPFFLFSMGAAIPLSLRKLDQEGSGFWQVLWIAGRRFFLLTFFAFFTYHMRAWVIAETPSAVTYALSIAAFGLLCFQFMETGKKGFGSGLTWLKLFAFAAAVALLYFLPFNKGEGFRFDKVDIILLVLGNMAFFGTVCWWLTRKRPVLRMGLLAFVMAVFLGGKVPGTWNEAVFNWSPIPWMYKFYYLKYLFIILPGTLAGEWLQEASKPVEGKQNDTGKIPLVGLLSFGLVVCNVALLFSRMLVLNLAISIAALSATIYFLLKSGSSRRHLLKKFWQAGSFLLLLGLFFEGYEGGIKKDPSTYSYYFVTSGLAFFMLSGLTCLSQTEWGTGINTYLSLNGRNPMVAYVAGSLLLTPVLHLTGAITLFNSMNGNAWSGFFKGLLFTAIVSAITVFFTKRKWFWKT